MRLRFTDAKVKAADLLPKDGQERIDHSDLAVEGLKLRVSRTHRSYRLELWGKVDGMGKRSREVMVLGDARHMTVEEARQKARDALKRRAIDGESLGAQKALQKGALADLKAMTFKRVAERFMAEYVTGGEAPLRARTAEGYKAALDRVEKWDPVPISRITDMDVLAKINELKGKGKLASARLWRAYMSRLFGWAVEQRIIRASPVPALPRAKRGEKKEAGRVLSSEELRAILNTAGKLKEARHGAFVAALVLLGQRRHETACMNKDGLDLGKGSWVIPAGVAKNHREHRIHVPSALVTILSRLPEQGGYVFQPGGKTSFANFSRLKLELDELLGEEFRPWTWHDLRRSLATGIADLGVEPFVIEEALNHKTGTRTSLGLSYNRSRYEEQTKAAWTLWANHLLTPPAKSNVVRLRT